MVCIRFIPVQHSLLDVEPGLQFTTFGQINFTLQSIVSIKRSNDFLIISISEYYSKLFIPAVLKVWIVLACLSEPLLLPDVCVRVSPVCSFWYSCSRNKVSGVSMSLMFIPWDLNVARSLFTFEDCRLNGSSSTELPLSPGLFSDFS